MRWTDAFPRSFFSLARTPTTRSQAHVESVAHDTFKVSKLTVQPGWKWSECIKPLVGTDSCLASHQGVVVSGAMTVVMDDGTKMSYKAGDTYYIPPGHDGWVEGDEPMVSFEFAPTDKQANVWDTKT